jgi:hypothetical protein
MFLARDVQAFLWMLLTAALSLFVGVMLVCSEADLNSPDAHVRLCRLW